jgi:D-glycero-D-manno-heptose 1,7-bisphosphate phosphatase
MLLRAMQALDIDPRRSLMVGDRLSDLQAGRNAGVLRNFLIHDHSKGEPADTGDGVFADLEALSIHFLHSSPTA